MTLVEVGIAIAIAGSLGNAAFSLFNRFNDIKHLKKAANRFYKFEKKMIRHLAVIETKLGINIIEEKDDNGDE